MTHEKAVRTIALLAPQLNAGSPEDVLIKYASDNDLAVAQLHKLSQVYNTHAQLSKMASAGDEGDRGDSCYQINHADLLARYVEGEPEKSAAIRWIEESDDVSTLNLNDELMALAFPKEASAQVVPAAAQPVPVVTLEDMVKVATAEELVKVAAEVKNAFWEARTDFQMEAEALLKEARSEAHGSRFLNLAADEEDAMHAAHPTLVKLAMAKVEELAGHMKPMKVVERFDGTLTKRAFAHTSPMASRIVRLANHMAEMVTMTKFAANYTIDQGPPETAEAETEAPAAETGAGMFDGIDPSTLNPEDPVDAEILAAMAAQKSSGPAAGAGTVPRPSPSAAPAAGGGGAAGGKGGGASGGAPSTGKATEKSSWLANLIGSLTGGVDAAASGVAGAAESADKTLQRVTGKERTNKPQRATDLSVQDIRRSIQVRRLIATDPVLRDADPQMVLRLYNSIANANPAAAQDMEAVRLALREATSYEGVTPDTLKTMGDIRKTQGQSEAQEHENTKRRYSIPT